MKKYFERLSSLERRFVIGVLVVVFLLLNVLFVWPRFADWNAAQVRLAKARKTLAQWQAEVNQSPTIQTQVKVLESEGAAVPPEDQSIDFLRTIQTQAAQSGVNILGNARQIARTNQFFLEQAQSITTQSGEEQLVAFLYNLGEGNSLIRVRDLSLRPDAPRQQLTANIKLVASYQKKPVTRAAPPAAVKPVVPAATPAPPPAAAKPAPATPTKKTP